MDRKERTRQYLREYNKTPQGIKSDKIKTWKYKGLIDNYDKVYDIYINTHECMKCQVDITGINKHMDHDHDTRLYRAILCRSCNIGNTLDLDCQKDNKLGIKYICRHQNGYKFQKKTKGKLHQKSFKTLEETIEYKNQYLLSLL